MMDPPLMSTTCCANCTHQFYPDNLRVSRIRIRPNFSMEQQEENESSISVQDALVTIYKLNSINKTNTTHKEDGETVVLCVDCAVLLQDCIAFFTQFNQLRKEESYVAKQLLELEAAIQTLQDLQEESLILKNQFLKEEPSRNIRTANLNSSDFGPGPWVQLERLPPQQQQSKQQQILSSNVKRENSENSNDPDNDSDVDLMQDTHDEEFHPNSDDTTENSDDPDYPGSMTLPASRSKLRKKRKCPTGRRKIHSLTKSADSSSEEDPSWDPADPSRSPTSDLAPHSCQVRKCGYTAPTKPDLILHTQIVHKTSLPKNFPCPKCDCRYVTKQKLKFHLSKHKKSTSSHPCPIENCGKTFLTLSALSKHHSIQHEDGEILKYCCNVCGLRFNRWGKLIGHQESHIPNPFACPRPKCSRKFATEKELEDHDSKCRSMECTICSKTFDGNSALQIHMACHTGERRFGCEYPDCDKRFVRKAHLIVHERAAHTGERPFVCSEGDCQLSFYSEGALRNHSKVHNPIRNSLCTECGESFKRMSTLHRHMRIHTGETPYCCEICGKKFGLPKTYKDHLLTHTGDKRHLCGTCGATFRHKHHLVRHEQTHSGILPYRCEVCGLAFPDNRPLKKHLLSHE